MNYYVYVIQSKSCNIRYIGHTHNILQRFNEHNSGKCHATRNRRPWELIYWEKSQSLDMAKKRERFFKTGDGRAALKNLIEQTNQADVAELAYAQD